MNNILFLNLEIILLKNMSSWVAQCVQYDIAAQGPTAQLAIDSLERTILGQIHLDIRHNIIPLSDCENQVRKLTVRYYDNPEA